MDELSLDKCLIHIAPSDRKLNHKIRLMRLLSNIAGRREVLFHDPYWIELGYM